MSKNRLKNAVITPLLAVSLFAGGATGIAALASAQTPTGTTTTTTQGMHQMGPHVDGTITAINGSTITITAEANHGGGTYTVDASAATVTKDGAASTLASFAVGDKVWATGTITGTNVVATTVSNGFGGKGFGPGGPGGHGRGPGVMGTVSAVSGNTITVANTDGTTYTIDASSAKVSKVVDLTVSDIKVGDTLGVMGTVSGTNVTATHIMDGVPPQKTQAQ